MKQNLEFETLALIALSADYLRFVLRPGVVLGRFNNAVLTASVGVAFWFVPPPGFVALRRGWKSVLRSWFLRAPARICAPSGALSRALLRCARGGESFVTVALHFSAVLLLWVGVSSFN